MYTLALTEEICNAEDFQPSCRRNEVIFMESAVYGRMSIGRCVKNDYGHLGCHNDVLSRFDSECSGKQSCELEVTTTLRRDVPGACGPAIFGYAQVSYKCQEGTCVTFMIILP